MAESILNLIKKPEGGITAMGYAYDIKDALAVLGTAREHSFASNNDNNQNGQGNAILGLGTTRTSSFTPPKFEGEFSTNKDYPLWRVELGLTNSLPVQKSSSSGYSMAKVTGEDYAVLWGNMRRKTVPPKLDTQHGEASKTALGTSGFSVGCMLDMNVVGVNYLNKFFPLPQNLDWNASHTASLISAGCLYVEFISGEAGEAIPIKVEASLPNKSGQIKLSTAIASLSLLKNMKIPVSVKEGGESSNVYNLTDGSSDVKFPYSESEYDYLKAEIHDFNPENFLKWAYSTSNTSSVFSFVPIPYFNGKSNYFVRLFIPESKRQDAKYALAGKGMDIPENLFQTSAQINYTPGQITYQQDDSTGRETSGNYEDRIIGVVNDIWNICGGSVNKGDGFSYSKSGRPQTYSVHDTRDEVNPYPQGSIKHRLFKRLKIVNSNDNQIFTYDCSSFVQLLMYNATGLKSDTVKPPAMSTSTMVNNGANTINQYIDPRFKAISMPFNINNVRPGDLLAKVGHAGLYVGPRGYPGANANSTVEMHGILSERSKYTLVGNLKPGRFTTIIRIVNNTDGNSSEQPAQNNQQQ